MNPFATSRISRRGFLQTAGAASLGLSAAPELFGAGEQDPFGGFIVGIQSYTYRNFSLEQTLQQIQKLGLRYIEITSRHLPTKSTPKQIEAVLRLCKTHQITPIAYGVESFSKDDKANRAKFEFARALGVRFLSADPSPDSFDSLDKLVAEFNIGIAIHPHGPQGKTLHRWYSAEAILGAVKNRHRLIGSCLDTGHLIRAAQDPFNRKLDPTAEVRVMGARNLGLHLKDHDNKRRTDVVFGRGALDVPAVLRALREVKFSGYISIEYEANPKDPTPDVRACLDVLRDSIRKIG